VLADICHCDAQAETPLRQAGIRPATIDFNGVMDLVWAGILVKRRNQSRLRPLIDVISNGGRRRSGADSRS